MNLFSFFHFFLQIGGNLTELIDSVAKVFTQLGCPQDAIAHITENLKGAIKIILSLTKNVLPLISTK